jgi:cysteinyl-tRNA synthetase
VDDMIVGSRSEVGEGKRNPMDSVLWKPSTIEQPGWQSPWGFGRPGWHIECSAMSRKLLGKQFDIHGGGLDLLFPHHENEIAQCRACDGPEASARYWLHNEMLQVEGKKMSKSLGNFFTVRDLLDKGIPGEVIRFVLLSTHYSKPMDFTMEKAEQAEATLKRWRQMCEGVEPAPSIPESTLDALSNDLNTAAAFGEMHGLAGTGKFSELLAAAKTLGFLTSGMSHWNWRRAVDLKTDRTGGDTFSGYAFTETAHERICLLLSRRLKARRDRDFAEADWLRDALNTAGVKVMDGPDGFEFEKLSTFDLEKLMEIQ